MTFLADEAVNTSLGGLLTNGILGSSSTVNFFYTPNSSFTLNYKACSLLVKTTIMSGWAFSTDFTKFQTEMIKLRDGLLSGNRYRMKM